MRKYSWYTVRVHVTELVTVYRYAVDRYIYLPAGKDGFGSCIHIKAGTFVTRHDGGWQTWRPNMKGGHTHNHVWNARMRMRKCHICGDPIVRGCEVISAWTHDEFQCRSCKENDCMDYCAAVGIHYGGVPFPMRRRRK